MKFDWEEEERGNREEDPTKAKRFIENSKPFR